jgi:hypothetical protein
VKVFGFLGANLFLLGVMLIGLATVALLVTVARLAGADDDTVHWLVFPIGLAGIAAMYSGGKLAHRALSRLI